MAALPTDQTRQFDYPPGQGRTVIDALAAPTPAAVTAQQRSDKTSDFGSDGTKAFNDGTSPTGGTSTARPAAGSNWIAGGAVSGYGTVAAGTNPAPQKAAHRDNYKNQTDTASVGGVASPVVTAGAIGGTSPTATVVLNWVKVPTATGYKIDKSVKSGAVWGAWGAGTPATVGDVATVTETGLSTGQVRFRVTATGGVKDSSPSSAVTVTIP